MIIQQNKME